MPNASTAELYFIIGMMTFLIIFSAAVIYIFFRTYKKEMREKEARKNETEKSAAQIKAKSEIAE